MHQLMKLKGVVNNFDTTSLLFSLRALLMFDIYVF